MSPELVIKLGAKGCLLAGSGKTTMIPTTPVEHVLDSTAAGDSFNAGYMAGRLAGLTSERSIEIAQQLAGEVIRHPGAIIPIAAMPVRVKDCLHGTDGGCVSHP